MVVLPAEIVTFVKNAADVKMPVAVSDRVSVVVFVKNIHVYAHVTTVPTSVQTSMDAVIASTAKVVNVVVFVINSHVHVPHHVLKTIVIIRLNAQYVTDVTTVVYVVLKSDVFLRQYVMNVTGAMHTVYVVGISKLNVVIPDVPELHAVIAPDVMKNTNAMYVKDASSKITVYVV